MARDIDLYNRNIGRGSRIPNIGIGVGQSGFTPATFQAGVFTPQKEDMSLLQRSLATLDERKEKTDPRRHGTAVRDRDLPAVIQLGGRSARGADLRHGGLGL